MNAYNRRFEPRRLFGMPLVTAAASAAASAAGALSWMTSGDVRLLFVTITLAAVAVALAALWLGDDLPLLPVLLLDVRERGLVVHEAWVRR